MSLNRRQRVVFAVFLADLGPAEVLGYDCAFKQAKLCLESPGVSSCAMGAIRGAALLEELLC